MTLRKNTNAPSFISNVALLQDLGIKPVEKGAALFYQRFFDRLEKTTRKSPTQTQKKMVP